MAELAAFQYRAFISYSHADTAWAKWLHRGLESFRIDKDLAGRATANGTVPASLRPVFRDRDDFTAGHSLTDQTLAALDGSAALVVLCSPAAAKSRYVNEEVRLFKARHPERPVVPLIVGGKPGDAENECFPPSLRFALDDDGRITDAPIELLAADAREEGDGKSLALAKVVAGLLGVSSDDIFRRAERERRRKGRIRNGIAAALAFLAIAATGSAVYAWEQLKTNEAFLTATLKRATDIVNTSVAQAESYGVPRKATLALLTQAEGLFDDMARLGRPTPELRYQKAWMLIQFARNYAVLGNTGKWESRTREAYALLESLSAAEPGNPEYQLTLSAAQQELGDVLLAQGKVGEALNAYVASRTTAANLAKSDQANLRWQYGLSVAHERVGDALLAEGNLPDALKAFRSSLAIRTALVAAAPDDTQWQRDLSIANEKIGNVLYEQGDLAAALSSYRTSLDLTGDLVKRDGSNAAWQRDLAVGYVKLGDVLLAQGDLDAALASYRKSLAIRQRLADADASNLVAQRDLAVAQNKVGDVLAAQGKLDAALDAYRYGLDVTETIAAFDRSNAAWQRDLSVSQMRIGNMLAAQGDLPGALEAYRSSLTIAEGLVLLDPNNAQWRRDLAVSYWKTATALAKSGASAEALAMFRRGREIVSGLGRQYPDNPQFPKDVAEFDAEIAALGQTDGSPAGQAAQ